MARETFSVSDKLLLAAYDLEERGQRPFTAEDLVVGAWRKFPDTFGLAGYQDEEGRLCHPDSNRVFAEIMGSKPIRKKGFLKKVGNKMYQLTEAGREHARYLLASGTESPVQKAGLARETKEQLRRLLASRAVEKVKNNRLGDLTFYDACAFWGITPMSSAIELKGQIAKLESIVESAQRAIKDQDATFEHGGYSFGAPDLDVLVRVHHALLQRFQSDLDVIRERGDERKI